MKIKKKEINIEYTKRNHNLIGPSDSCVDAVINSIFVFTVLLITRWQIGKMRSRKSAVTTKNITFFSLSCWSYSVKSSLELETLVSFSALLFKLGKWSVFKIITNTLCASPNENLILIYRYIRMKWILFIWKPWLEARTVNICGHFYWLLYENEISNILHSFHSWATVFDSNLIFGSFERWKRFLLRILEDERYCDNREGWTMRNKSRPVRII